ncbi:MAG: threonine/serine dehydratase [Pseudomonadota bacterium]
MNCGPTLQQLRQAAERIEPVVRRTPLLESPLLNKQLDARIIVKPECLQVTGSFKIRGAFNKISCLSETQRKRGVVAFSSGNHAQGVAYAARYFGIDATIVMPEDAPAIKIENTRLYGAEVVLYNRYTENREEIGEELCASQGRSLIKPYDDPEIICGQGTVGLEALEDTKRLGVTVDQILCPCGGGGLISGIASAASHLSPSTKVFAVEPKNFDDTVRSLNSGQREIADASVRSICDAIVTPQPGELTFSINRTLLSGGYVVSEEDVLKSMGIAFREFKIVAEPGGIVALAALIAEKGLSKNSTSLIVVSGGNTDREIFSRALKATALHF